MNCINHDSSSPHYVKEISELINFFERSSMITDLVLSEKRLSEIAQMVRERSKGSGVV